MSYPEAPVGYAPPPPPPLSEPTRRGPSRSVVAVIALAALVAVGGVGLLASGAGRNLDATDGDVALRQAASTPAATGSPDRARIDAIIRDAHSGAYFGNDYASTYPSPVEIGFVRGTFRSGQDLPDRAAACMLSYVETNYSFVALMRHADRAKQIGITAAFRCAKYA
jgi:hypothetical protein